MKRLTKIRLINWHYFGNETINIKNNVLLTGQNATGKSTILDALTYVITAGDTQFNLAANEKGKRDLRGYVKCKIGADDKQYLRDGDVTGHVALEFYDETKQEYFTCGTVIDCIGDVLPAKSIFYSAMQRLDDNNLVQANGVINSTQDFKKFNPKFEIYLTKKEAKRSFRTLYGSLSEDFFKLIPKALAFKPIGDVKDFIYQHLLEEKQIDVENIKDSIRSYKELERMLNLIKTKINSLKAIEEVSLDIDATHARVDYLTYMHQLFEEKSMILFLDKQKAGKTKLEQQLSDKSQSINRCIDSIEELQERAKELYKVLANDDAFSQNEYLDKQIAKNKALEEETSIKYQEYLKQVSYVNALTSDLKEFDDNQVVKKINNLSLNTVKRENVSDMKLKLADYEQELRVYSSYLNQKIGSLEVQKNSTLGEITNISNQIRSLENRTLRYNPEVTALKQEIQSGLKQIYGTEISVYILAELLEITDKKWATTVEVYLGNQRFNLIVEPRYFDAALQVYNRVKSTKQIYNVGLVNTKKISNYNTCSPDSMANIITSENVDAKRYINMIVGNLILCSDVKELENYNSSITVDGMVYKSFTVRSMNFNAVKKPFIGANALEDQKAQSITEAAAAKKQYDKIVKQIEEIKTVSQNVARIDLKELEINCSLFSDLQQIKENIKDFTQQKSNQNIFTAKDMQDDYNNLLDKIKRLEEDKIQLVEERGSISNQIANAEKDINELEDAKTAITNKLIEIRSNSLEIEVKAQEEMASLLSESKDVNKHLSDFNKKKDVERLNFEQLVDRISALQLKYNQEYHSEHALGITELYKYLNELEKLEKSEIITYENKVRSAREDAELLFKEDFLSKLRNYIMSAEDEIAKINDTLSTFQFGEDKYEFVFPKSEEFSIFYDMVTEDLETVNEGFFTIDFEQKYNEQLEMLFSALAVDEENSQGSINKFTDYRTYMDYDIKITNLDGENVYYSKVSKEKSGGETQVPFYVAILASFVRIYQKNTNNLNDAIGLVMFDEVFDKMDSRRMQSMMGFINTLPIQIFLACPPQRMEILQQYTDTTIITIRDNKTAQIANLVSKD
ncbi:MAG: SbcC/MukB-like Walker B domain-containing protein [bacterium]